MCGRYYLSLKIEKIINRYGTKYSSINYSPKTEVFPSQNAPVILGFKEKTIKLFKWGFSKTFSKRLIINARAETVAEKPTFKKAFKKQRCLIPASGFFEWKTVNHNKIKYKISPGNKSLFSFAGLYDFFSDNDGNTLPAFTIITTPACDKIKNIHDRMPAIIKSTDEDKWLNKNYDLDKLQQMLKPYQDKIQIEENNNQLRFDF